MSMPGSPACSVGAGRGTCRCTCTTSRQRHFGRCSSGLASGWSKRCHTSAWSAWPTWSRASRPTSSRRHVLSSGSSPKRASQIDWLPSTWATSSSRLPGRSNHWFLVPGFGFLISGLWSLRSSAVSPEVDVAGLKPAAALKDRLETRDHGPWTRPRVVLGQVALLWLGLLLLGLILSLWPISYDLTQGTDFSYEYLVQ